jgi:hypothetical protein
MDVMYRQPIQTRSLILQETGVAHWLSVLATDPAVVRFRENSRGYWLRYRPVILLFTIALLCDAVSTVHFMRELGARAELHPAVRWASVAFGPVLGPLIGAAGKALACFFVTICCRRYALSIFIAATAIYLVAAWYNIWGIYLFV